MHDVDCMERLLVFGLTKWRFRDLARCVLKSLAYVEKSKHLHIVGINVHFPPCSLFLFLLFGVQKEVVQDFISGIQGAISGLGGSDHASGLRYHDECVFSRSQQIFVEGLPCAKLSCRHSR